MSFATPQDLADRWRPLSSAEMDRAAILLGDAETEIRAEFRRAGWTVEERIDAGAVSLDDLLLTSVDMVKRAMLAPVDQAPMAQVQQTSGPFSQSGTFVNPTGDLYLTRKDRRRLGLGGQRAASVSMGPTLTTAHAAWCGVWTGILCTCGAAA